MNNVVVLELMLLARARLYGAISFLQLPLRQDIAALDAQRAQLSDAVANYLLMRASRYARTAEFPREVRHELGLDDLYSTLTRHLDQVAGALEAASNHELRRRQQHIDRGLTLLFVLAAVPGATEIVRVCHIPNTPSAHIGIWAIVSGLFFTLRRARPDRPPGHTGYRYVHSQASVHHRQVPANFTMADTCAPWMRGASL